MRPSLIIGIVVLSLGTTSVFADGLPGFVLKQVLGTRDNAYALAVQPDGKIVVAGSGANPRGNSDIVIARFEKSGEPDVNFGQRGVVITDYGDDEEAYSMELQSDGKIVIAGTAKTPREVFGTEKKEPFHDFMVARYLASGAVDDSFGDKGKVTYGFGFGHDKAFGVTILPSGEIAVAGTAYVGQDYDVGIVKYLPTGVLDEKFNSLGVVKGAMTVSYGVEDDFANAIIHQPDGKLIIAGNSRLGRKNLTTIARYDQNGIADSTFGAQGKIVMSLRGTHDNAFAMGLQKDGRIVVAGSTSNGADLDFAVVRYHSDGNLDLSFGNYGKKIARVGHSLDNVYALAIQSDGKIILAGNYFEDGAFDYDHAMIRLSRKGQADYSFGRNGKVRIAAGPKYDSIYAVGLQKDGKIVTAGVAGDKDKFTWVIGRFLTSGEPDASFGAKGRVIAGGMEGLIPKK